MGDEPYTTRHTTSSQRSDHSTQNLQAEYAAERAELMFGCYRRGDANNPDTYVAAVAMVLSKFSVEVIKAVTDPYSGLPSKKKENGYSGLPDVADVREACDDEAGRIARMDRYRQLPAPDFNRKRLAAPQRAPGDLATVFVPESNPRYQALLEWSKTADGRKFKFEQRPGIWVAHDIWDARQIAARMSALKPVPLTIEASDLLNTRATAAPPDRPAYQEAWEP